MTSVQQIRDAIATVIATVTGAGRVHTYQRFTKRADEFKDIFVYQNRVRAWMIRRVATLEASPALGRAHVTHRWRIDFYVGLNDAEKSELTFDTLIEAARDAFRADETLGGIVAGTAAEGVNGLQVDDAGPVIFGEVLCHEARLRLHTFHTQ